MKVDLRAETFEVENLLAADAFKAFDQKRVDEYKYAATEADARRAHELNKARLEFIEAPDAKHVRQTAKSSQRARHWNDTWERKHKYHVENETRNHAYHVENETRNHKHQADNEFRRHRLHRELNADHSYFKDKAPASGKGRTQHERDSDEGTSGRLQGHHRPHRPAT